MPKNGTSAPPDVRRQGRTGVPARTREAGVTSLGHGGSGARAGGSGERRRLGKTPLPPDVGSEKSAQAHLHVLPTRFAQGGKPEVHVIVKLGPYVDLCTIEGFTTPRTMHRTPPSCQTPEAPKAQLFLLCMNVAIRGGAYPRDSRRCNTLRTPCAGENLLKKLHAPRN